MTFSERLICVMKLKGLKQAELAKRSGLAPGTISNYILGRYSAKGKNLRILAEALDVNPAWLEGICGAPMQPSQSLVESETWEEEWQENNRSRYSFSDLEYMLIERYRMAEPRTQKIILALLDLEDMAEDPS